MIPVLAEAANPGWRFGALALPTRSWAEATAMMARTTMTYVANQVKIIINAMDISENQKLSKEI